MYFIFILVFFCCIVIITLSNLKQYLFISSQFCRSGVQHDWVLCSGYQEAEVKVSARLRSPLKALGENLLQSSYLLAQCSFLGLRALFPCWLSARGCRSLEVAPRPYARGAHHLLASNSTRSPSVLSVSSFLFCHQPENLLSFCRAPEIAWNHVDNLPFD